jgi:alpha-tubulin suppressor-like RCC1 family protein
MKVLRRSRRLALAAGCAALAAGAAGMAAVPATAQARVTATASQPQVVASWGHNSDQLGDGTMNDRSLFGDIGAGRDVVQVSAGWEPGPSHVLALRSDGTVWAWGGNGFGEVGDGTTINRTAPVQVTGLTGVTQVAAGTNHSLALRSDGTVWAWGYNNAGQLGNGSTASSAVPVKVAGLSHVTGISAGYQSCVATATNGISVLTSVWTWGGNYNGELGDGTLAGRTTPAQVTGLPAYIAGATAGAGFAAVLGTDGSVWAWGFDETGQLGNAPAAAPVTRPVNTIGIGSGITQISAGAGGMLALKSNGTVLAWGDNTFGELGTGTTASVAGPVQVTGLTGATQVAYGSAAGFAVHVPQPLATVPDLTGDGQARASQVLQADGLVLGAVTKVTDKYCANLGVMSQNPLAGTAVRPGSAVSVTIGQPPASGCP